MPGGGGGAGLLGPLGSLISGGLGFAGAQQGIDAQVGMANQANQLQMAMFGITQAELAPYRKFGEAGMNRLQNSIGNLTARFNPTMAQLEKTPGYQFTLGEGLKATQNAGTAQGLGQSGFAMKGAEQYATGLASTTYQQQLQNYMAQNAQKYNMLMGMTQIGAGAAAGTAQAGQFAGSQVGANLIGAGNAIAGGTAAGYNSIGSGINNALGQYYNWSLMNKMYPGA